LACKVTSLGEAIAAHVRSGMTVFVGGFGQGVPFAAGREIVRQRIGGLTLCRTGADILFDYLVAGGCADRLVVGWYGNPGLGLSHVWRRRVNSGGMRVEETSNFALLLRLLAGSLGVPFLPTRTLTGGELPTLAAGQSSTITCPFTAERLQAVPALNPDVAIIHAQQADANGNVQMWGIVGDTVLGAKASNRVVCTVERIVSAEVIRSTPDRTVLPGHRVDAVVEAPFGAHPSYVQDFYDRDDAFYSEFDRISRDEAGLNELLEREIIRLPDHAAYVAQQAGRLSGLRTWPPQ
jgi:glutaconate CoA-transferase, subunit A